MDIGGPKRVSSTAGRTPVSPQGSLSANPARIRNLAAEFRGSSLLPESLKQKFQGILTPMLSDSHPDVRRFAAEAVSKLGDTNAALSVLKPLLSDSHPDVRSSAAEAVSKLGDTNAALSVLKPMLSDSNIFVRCSAARAVGKLTDINAIEIILEDLKSDKELLLHLLTSFLENYNLPLPFSIQSPVLKHANLIRFICKQEYHPERQTLAPSKGFGNRGMRPGTRTQPSGWDFQQFDEAHSSQVDSRRIDWAATERLPAAKRAQGIVAIRKFRSEEANKIMIVIDPRAIDEENKQNLGALAGTIAQMALQRKDLVGLIIGRHKVYLKPSQDKTQLEAVLARVISYYREEAEETGVVQLLDQETLRKNLPPGAEIYLISNFTGEDAQKLKRIGASFAGINVNFVPIALGREISMPHPVIEVGRFRWKMDPPAARIISDIRAKRIAKELNDFLYNARGCAINLEGKETEVALRTVKSLTGKAPQKEQIKPKGKLVGEKVYNIETREPENLLGVLEDTIHRHDKEGLNLLLQTAHLRGWGTIFTYVYGKIMEFLSDHKLGEYTKEKLERFKDELEDNLPEKPNTRDSFISIKHRSGFSLEYYSILDDLERDRFSADNVIESVDDAIKDEKGNSPAAALYRNALRAALSPSMIDPALPEILLAAWGLYTNQSTANVLIDALQERTKNRSGAEHRRPTIKTAFSKPETAVSPLASAVDREETKDDHKIWQILAPAPTERQRYLRHSLGLARNPGSCSFDCVGELNSAALAETGNRNISGKLVSSLDKETILPQPAGGRILIRKGKKIVYAINENTPPETAGILSMKLSEFRRRAKEIYGEDLHQEALTAPATLEQIRKINPEIGSEWRALLDKVENLTVEEAIVTIKNYVLSHPKLKYHRYESDVKKTLLGALKRRIEKGEAEGHEYLELILKLGGGTCVEMSTIGLTLLRLAGIPTGLSQGYLAEENGEVKQMGHAWAEVVIPYGSGKWYGLPVEFSEAQMAKIDREATAARVETIERKIEEEKVAEERRIAISMPDIDRAFFAASPEVRTKMAGWLETLETILDLKGEKWHGTDIYVSDLILQNPSAYQMSSQITDVLPSRKINRIIITHHQTGRPATHRDLDLFRRWWRAWEEIA